MKVVIFAIPLSTYEASFHCGAVSWKLLKLT